MYREWEGMGQETGGLGRDFADGRGAGDQEYPLITLAENTSLSTRMGLLEITKYKLGKPTALP